MSVAIEEVRDALEDDYDILREVGRGAMAAVYLAERETDGADVAVKVFDPVYEPTKWSQRFRREIEVLRDLDHPSIQPVLAAGESGRLVYYVMPYANQGSLEHGLLGGKRLSLRETIRIARPIADALDYAHARNVVHRDIKPGNILLHEGASLLCDFGIARAIKHAGGEFLTSIGVRLGTPTYMSPEQALGEPNLAGPSDTYSLACVVYEMLVGEPVFTGRTDQAVMAKHAKQHPPHVRVVRPDLPGHVEDVLQAALAKHPNDRPASGAEFVAGLAHA